MTTMTVMVFGCCNIEEKEAKKSKEKKIKYEKPKWNHSTGILKPKSVCVCVRKLFLFLLNANNVIDVCWCHSQSLFGYFFLPDTFAIQAPSVALQFAI